MKELRGIRVRWDSNLRPAGGQWVVAFRIAGLRSRRIAFPDGSKKSAYKRTGRPGELKIYGWSEGEYMIADFDSKRTYRDHRLMMGRFDRKFHEQWESLPTSLSFDSVAH